MRLIVPPPLRSGKNTHLETIVREFGPPAKQTIDIQSDTRFLFICFSNRCGSNYLAQLLASTDEFNVAGEFYNSNTILENAKRHGLLTFGDVFSHYVRSLSKKRWFVSKISIDQIVMLHDFGVLQQIFERSTFIMMERGDKLAQALSLSIALQSQQWTSEQAARIQQEDLCYSAEDISRLIEGLAELYKKWDLFFSYNGINPIQIWYESLIARPQLHMSIIGEWLGVERLRINGAKVSIKRQASAINETWKSSFTSDSSRTIPQNASG